MKSRETELPSPCHATVQRGHDDHATAIETNAIRRFEERKTKGSLELSNLPL